MNNYYVYLLMDDYDASTVQALARLFFEQSSRYSQRGGELLPVPAMDTAHRAVWQFQSDEAHACWKATSLATAEVLRRDVYCLSESQYKMKPQLLVSDMDSTMIAIEVIDELANLAGVGDAVSAVTEQAMRGELDFNQSLEKRVACLKGLSTDRIEHLKQRLPLNPGAETLLHHAQLVSLKTALVSGGFLPFVQVLQNTLGFDHVLANQLEVKNGCLTGHTTGQIVNGEEKARYLLQLCSRYAIDASSTIALGDGANDLPMMEQAGLSVAYHAKPIVNNAADMCIQFGGLDRVAQHFGWVG